MGKKEFPYEILQEYNPLTYKRSIFRKELITMKNDVNGQMDLLDLTWN